VPNVIGLQLGKAKQRIRDRNCTVGKVRRVRSLRSLRGRVVGQKPRGGAERRQGFPVNLLVGRGGRH
jgi:beta-lactam-binding protein with PASTA domain